MLLNELTLNSTEKDPVDLSISIDQLALLFSNKMKTSSFPLGEKSNLFRKEFFPNASKQEWNDWHWQLSNRINSESLFRMFLLTDAEKKALNNKVKLPLNITPYYASLINRDDLADPLRKAVIPVFSEFLHSKEEALDPLAEEHCSPVEGIVHRYPDRVLFLVTDFCSTNCRYCTRSRLVGHQDSKYNFNFSSWEKGIKYIAEHSEIRDVLISGGDPLTLPEEYLDWILSRIRQISHVEVVRIGTKVPVVMPMRITNSLVRMLKKHHPLWISIHFTHPNEFTPESKKALERLADVGIPLGSQTVLLKGINDDVATMKSLMHKLMQNRVKPYYLYQCDPILGSSHFRTSIEKGIEIIEGLRGHTSGYAIPTYVIDAPGGGGKIPIIPNYYLGKDKKNVILRNYEHKKYYYPID